MLLDCQQGELDALDSGFLEHEQSVVETTAPEETLVPEEE